MARLSSSVADLKRRYDAVVVGSGYGGAIAACRLAQAGFRVCVLERGREIRPGEYPDTAAKAAGEIQLDLPGRHLFSPTALFDFRLNQEVNVLVGCGLGGTSLINANVALKPEEWVLRHESWPAAFRRAGPELLAPYFNRALQMLSATPYPPDGFPPLLKQQALEAVQRVLAPGGSFARPLITVNFRDGVNVFGVQQGACQLCGDCVTGCNYGAKNTVLMNYLPEARRHGAELFTETGVRTVLPCDGEWVVEVEVTGSRRAFCAPPLSVRAPIVMLAAGALGSTEILLRSRDAGLKTSARLGCGFTGNGDVLALAYNGSAPIDGVGAGARRPDMHHQVGPCITGLLDLRKGTTDPEQQMIIEEGSIPGALSAVIPGVLKAAAVMWGRSTGSSRARSVTEQVTRWARHLTGAYHGAVRRTQTLLAMAHDGSDGRMRLVDDRLRVEWTGVESRPIFGAIAEKLERASEEWQATHIPNPFRLITVHPLGGCGMADHARDGVVDDAGRVFTGETGTGVHDGLYVCDGAVVPRSLGANPLLTICALAERTATLLVLERRPDASRRGRQAPRAVPPPVPPDAVPPIPTPRPTFHERVPPGLEFVEQMSGEFSWVRKRRRGPLEDAPERRRTSPVDDTAPWLDATRRPTKTHPLTLNLTVIAADVEALVSQRDHAAHLIGTVTAKALSAGPLQVTDGRLHLFLLASEHVETRVLRYWMRLEAEDPAGRAAGVYYLEGEKVARNRVGARLWRDLSTLYVTIASEDGRCIGRGIARLSFSAFLRQLTTVRARHARGLGERLDVNVRFYSYFLGMLRSLYGRMLAGVTLSTLDAPPRPRRPQACAATHPVQTSDGTVIHLTRHHGGDRGPVLLSPGFSVRANSFAADTVDENLVERLVRERYDVWLLDYRASSGFAAAGTEFSIDDIATRDYPAAVDKVIAESGRARIQVLAHCVGSMALLMSLLAGKLDGRLSSVICSQLGLHPIPPRISELKAALYFASVLRRFGFKRLTARYDPYSLTHRFVDRLLTLIPTHERCTNPTCRRILLLFGESFRHDQLNTATHDAMHEWFGTTSLPGLAHLALMVRVGHTVDKDGREAYLPHLGRLALPISFIHGTRNREFLPEATWQTFSCLCKENGPDLYRWRAIPNYGHMDCFIGKDAARDVFPIILEELEEGPQRGLR